MKLKHIIKSALGVSLIISAVVLLKMNVTNNTSVIINENDKFETTENYSKSSNSNGAPVIIPPDNSLDVKNLPIPSSSLSLPLEPLLKSK